MNPPNTTAEWDAVWANRGDSFNEALERYPRFRDEERNQLIERAGLEAGMKVLEVAACGGCLSRGIIEKFGQDIELFAIEPSEVHQRCLPEQITIVSNSDICSFSLPDQSFDRVLNLAGLHHSSSVDQFFDESYRVLGLGGGVAVADVAVNSTVAEWLNVYINDNMPGGHCGRFFEDGEITKLLTQAGFKRIQESRVEVFWHFESEKAMHDCISMMFCLPDIPTLTWDLGEILGWETNGDCVALRWELIYGFGEKCP